MRSNTSPVRPADHENSGPNEQWLALADPKAYRRARISNPLQAGIIDFLEQRQSHGSNSPTDPGPKDLISKLPKRYTLYSPLLLLPANLFTVTPEWRHFYAGLSASEKQELYARITEAFRGQGPGVTHIAVNSPIAAVLSTGPGESRGETLNVTRSPAGLVPLHGDWGPREMCGRVDGGLTERCQPKTEDLESAFWVAAVQNCGVAQVWAPLWTMFSRGNIKEKARILAVGDGRIEGLDNGGKCGVLGQDMVDISVVDLFVGIGYFAFSYLRRGVGLVWGWEINGWSVEGLRRGCQSNGWRVEVLKVLEGGHVMDEHGREGHDALTELVESLNTDKDGFDGKAAIRCVVFHGDNKWSGKTMKIVADMSLQLHESIAWKRVRHVNLGLLPHARTSWQDSVNVLDSQRGGWLHVHENVDVRDLQSRKDEIAQEIGKLVAEDVAKCGQWETSCCHVEEVKTYAPGVMHCVFDIQILPAR